jgi:hypothetical protein
LTYNAAVGVQDKGPGRKTLCSCFGDCSHLAAKPS